MVVIFYTIVRRAVRRNLDAKRLCDSECANMILRSMWSNVKATCWCSRKTLTVHAAAMQQKPVLHKVGITAVTVIYCYGNYVVT